MTAPSPKRPGNAAEKQLKRGFLCHVDKTDACPERCFRCGGPVGKAVNGPSIDGIIQKPDEVVGEVVAVLDATLSHVAYAAALDEISLWPSGCGSCRATTRWRSPRLVCGPRADLSAPLRQNAARENRARSCARGCGSGRRATAGAGTHCLGITSPVAV